MNLWAFSDLHVGHPENRIVVEDIEPHPQDWLALAGDLGETAEHLLFVIKTLAPRFARLLWVPGNHELWTAPREDPRSGMAKYQHLVDLCRAHNVLTPEDPYPVFDDGSQRYLIAPLFLLYDYTFCPDGLDASAALDWAAEADLVCADEFRLLPDPYPSRAAWCMARCAYSEARLRTALQTYSGKTVLINHFPLLREHAELPLIPRFSIWCGTRRTEDWHLRYSAAAVVYGHLHIPKLRHRDGVRFHEVSLGYPRQWRRFHATSPQPRQILPVAP